MTKEQVHEALCKAPDEDKMRLAIACQMNGIDVQDVETGLANVGLFLFEKMLHSTKGRSRKFGSARWGRNVYRIFF